jgi:hypothetical protein
LSDNFKIEDTDSDEDFDIFEGLEVEEDPVEDEDYLEVEDTDDVNTFELDDSEDNEFDVVDLEVDASEEEEISNLNISATSDDQEELTDQVVLDPLVNLVVIIANYAVENKWDVESIRRNIFDSAFADEATKLKFDYDDLLMASDETDTEYNNFLFTLYPLWKKFYKSYESKSTRDSLIKVLTTVVTNVTGATIVAPEILSPEDNKSPVNTPLEEEATSKDIVSTTPDLVFSETSSDIVRVVADIMKSLDALYKPSFTKRAKGVLTEEGLLSFNPTTNSVFIDADSKLMMKRLFLLLDLKSDGVLKVAPKNKSIDSSFFDKNGSLVFNYSPFFHLRNLNGLLGTDKESNWAVFRDRFKKDLIQIILNILNNAASVNEDLIGVMQGQLIDLFTNCIVIYDFDSSKFFSMRFRLQGKKINLGSLLSTEDVARRVFISTAGKVLTGELGASQVYHLIYLFDADRYNSGILFAYKAYKESLESNNGVFTSDLSNVIIGRSLKGNNVSINLEENSKILDLTVTNPSSKEL